MSSPRNGTAAWALNRTNAAVLCLLALPLLGVARLIPGTGFGLWLRLVAATLVLLIPGVLVSCAVRLRGAASAIAWSLAALVPALLVVFLVHTRIWVALVPLAVIAAVAFPFALRAGPGAPARGTVVVSIAGLAFGIVLWHVAGVAWGDALFHLGRVRKLVDLGSLHVRSVDEFADGGLHPGYAFPLWHAFLALVAKLGGVDPTQVMAHEPSAIAPFAFATAYEAGRALFRTAWLGVAVLVAAVAAAALAPGHGGTFALLGQPGALDRQVLAFATLAVFFRVIRTPRWPEVLTLAALGGCVFLLHASTAVFLLLPLVGFVAARLLLARRDLRTGLLALAAYVVPGGLALAWIAPIVRETSAQSPGRVETHRALTRYCDELTSCSGHHYALRPEIFARGGAISVAALALVPLAAFAPRKRWAAFVLGGSLVVLAVELVPWIFPHFASAISLSQARRAAGFLPFVFAFTGGAAVIACVARFLVLPIALGAGIALQLAYPGGFGTLSGGGPSLATWIAVVGGGLAVAAGLLLRVHKEARGPLPALAACLFAIPVAVHGFQHWTPMQSRDPYALTPGLLRALDRDVPKRAIVFSDLETSYRISAYVPVYVVSAPPAHVANTKANDPYRRRRATLRYLRTGDIRIPERYHATWIVIDRTRYHVRVPWRLVYSDSHFALYHRSP